MPRKTVDPERSKRNLLGRTMVQFQDADRRAASFYSPHPANTVEA